MTFCGGKSGINTRSNTMAMSKIFVGCNALTSIQQEAYVSHCQNWYRWGKELSEYDLYELGYDKSDNKDDLRKWIKYFFNLEN